MPTVITSLFKHQLLVFLLCLKFFPPFSLVFRGPLSKPKLKLIHLSDIVEIGNLPAAPSPDSILVSLAPSPTIKKRDERLAKTANDLKILINHGQSQVRSASSCSCHKKSMLPLISKRATWPTNAAEQQSNRATPNKARQTRYLVSSTNSDPGPATAHFQLINPTTFQHYYLGISQIFPLITPSETKGQASECWPQQQKSDTSNNQYIIISAACKISEENATKIKEYG